MIQEVQLRLLSITQIYSMDTGSARKRFNSLFSGELSFFVQLLENKKHPCQWLFLNFVNPWINSFDEHTAGVIAMTDFLTIFVLIVYMHNGQLIADLTVLWP